MRKTEEKSANEKLTEFEAKHPRTVEVYKQFMNYTAEQKNKARELWDEYYAECRMGIFAELYEEMKKALKMSLLGRMSELREQLKELKAGVVPTKKPTMIDPYWIWNNPRTNQFRMLLSAKKLEDQKNTIRIEKTGIFEGENYE